METGGLGGIGWFNEKSANFAMNIPVECLNWTTGILGENEVEHIESFMGIIESRRLALIFDAHENGGGALEIEYFNIQSP